MGIEVDGANQKLILDSDGDTYIEGATDDTLKVYVSGAEDLRIGANAINVLSGTTLTIDSGATITNSGTANGFGSNLPSSADGQALGSASAEWSDLFLADGGIIKFGNDQDITLTHVPDTGLILGGTTPTLTIGDAGAEDTKIVFDGNAQDFHIGLDDTDDDFKIGLGSTLGTTAHIVIDEAGHVTMPLTSAFCAVGPASSQDVNTSNQTTVTISTERFDQNADYNTGTYTFTAPVTGRYQLNANVVATDIEDEYLYLQIVTSNDTYGGVHQIPDTSGAEYELISVSHLVDMDAGDTAVVQVNSESDTSFDLRLEECEFSGFLAC